MREGYRSIGRSLILLTLSAHAMACGASSNAAGSTEDPKQQAALTACTADIDRTNGKACAKEGMACDFVVACEALSQLAQCTCNGGRFACTDSTGDVLPGSPPQCVKNAAPSTEPCPTTLADASGVTCDTLGRSCFFEGDLCPERSFEIHLLDYCQCARSSAGKLTYVCTKAMCNPALQ